MSAIINKVFEEYNSGELYRKIDQINSSYEDMERIGSLILLCYSYQWETDLAERENILKTIEEIVDDTPINLSQCKDVGSCHYGTCTAEDARLNLHNSINQSK